MSAELSMTKTCARDLTDRINSSSEDLAGMLKRAHDEKAWRALGYADWKSYVRVEIKFSERHAFRLLDFANITGELADCPIGQSLPAPTSESVTRPLKKVEPAKRPEVYAKAVESAGGEQPTARQVEAAVVEVLKPEPVVQAKPEPKKEPLPKYIPAVAVDIANNAIRILGTINDKDTRRVEALRMVITYCETELS